MTAHIYTMPLSVLFGFFAPGFQPEGQPTAPVEAAPVHEPEGDQPAADAPPPRPRAPELSSNLGWLNTDRPLRFSDELKGQVVVLDFWTSCCVNCMHAAEDMRQLEAKYKDQPVVFIGVHSAKFTAEADRSAIRAAVQRMHIGHPVVIDDRMALWQAYDIQGWPSFIIVGPDGLILARTSGEGRREMLDAAIRNILEYGRKNTTLAEKPPQTVPDAACTSVTGLRFPGKVLAVAPGASNGPDARGWLFIADSSNHRVIAATWPDSDGRSEVVKVVGGETSALVDGAANIAAFRAPQGLAYDRARAELYVADTGNHAVRAVSTRDWTVRTIAGNGTRGTDLAGGQSGRGQSLASPWDLALAPDGASLTVAMAGSHQLWTIDLATAIAHPIAGAGGEAIIDGPAAEAALAQPSGLAFAPAGEQVYFVDAESSALRVLDLKSNAVRTIVGVDLFVFGDADGPGRRASFQHPLGVALAHPNDPADETLLIADTFNDAMRLVDGKTQLVSTWSTPDMGLNEPGGVHVAGEGAARRVFIADTNNHRVLMIDPGPKACREVMFDGLRAPTTLVEADTASPKVELALAPGKAATIVYDPAIASGERFNAEAPLTLVVRERSGEIITQRSGLIDRFPVSFTLPASTVREGSVVVFEASYAVCRDGANASCRPVWDARELTVTPGTQSSAMLP